MGMAMVSSGSGGSRVRSERGTGVGGAGVEDAV